MAQTHTLSGTIAAYFEDNSDARRAVDALHEAGFASAHMGVAHRGPYTSAKRENDLDSDASTRTAGAEPSTWEKIKQWFTGDTAEPYADERTRGELATHEITQNPADSTRFDESYDETSDLYGSFTSMDIPAERSRYFAHRFRDEWNGAVVTVRAGDRMAEADSILSSYNGDLGTNSAGYDFSQTSVESTTSGEYAKGTERAESPRDIQLLGEILRVHKETINRGEARVRKEVVTENQTVQVPVRREELVVERKPVEGDKRAVAGTLVESEVRIPLSEEQASLGKSTVVREEVSVGKKPVEEVRELKGDVRHEELVVDDDTKRERSA